MLGFIVNYRDLLLLFINVSLVYGVIHSNPSVGWRCQSRCRTGHAGLPNGGQNSNRIHESLSTIESLASRPSDTQLRAAQIPTSLPWPHPRSASGRRVFYGRSRFWNFVPWEASERPFRTTFTWRAPIVISRLEEVAMLQVELRGLLVTPVVRVTIWNSNAQTLEARYRQAFGRLLNRITVVAGLYTTPMAAIGPRMTSRLPELIQPQRVFTRRGTLSRILPNRQGRSAPWITWTFATNEGDSDDDDEAGSHQSRLAGYGDRARIGDGHTWGTHLGHWPTDGHSPANDDVDQPGSNYVANNGIVHGQETFHRDYELSRLRDTAGSVLLFQWTITIDDEPFEFAHGSDAD